MSARVSKRTSVVPAAPSGPCATCPWVVANQGKRTADGWYTKANLRRLWTGLRAGERMTCHKTDPDNQPLPGMAEANPDRPTRECTGAVVLAQRELQRINDVLVAGGSWADYRRANPKGLTKEGAAVQVSALMYGNVPAPLGTLGVPNPDLNDERVVYAELVPWVLR